MHKVKTIDSYFQILNTDYSYYSLEDYLDNTQKSLSRQGLNTLVRKIIKQMINNEDNYLNILENYINETNIMILFDTYLSIMDEEKLIKEKFFNIGISIYNTIKSFKKLKDQVLKKNSNFKIIFSKESFIKILLENFKLIPNNNEISSKEVSDYCFDVKVNKLILYFF